MRGSSRPHSERHLRVAALFRRSRGRRFAYRKPPAAHWRQIRSTNPRAAHNREIGRRDDVVGILPATMLR
ncbi:MAG: transposase [Myxococcales bacterium]|nr:transposase [Myxococcales bacterium]